MDDLDELARASQKVRSAYPIRRGWRGRSDGRANGVSLGLGIASLAMGVIGPPFFLAFGIGIVMVLVGVFLGFLGILVSLFSGGRGAGLPLAGMIVNLVWVGLAILLWMGVIFESWHH